jgi:hypothetical protein
LDKKEKGKRERGWQIKQSSPKKKKKTLDKFEKRKGKKKIK